LGELEGVIVAELHDKMTQCRYQVPLDTFALTKAPEPWYEVDIVGKGRAALEQVNDHLGMSLNRILHTSITKS